MKAVYGAHRKLAVAVLTLLGAAVAPATAAATTYYVSPVGRDNASGRSAWQPWRSVYRVNKAHLHPGDTVLFRGGATFGDDSLQPGWGTGVSGSSRAPVTFSSYGGGRATMAQGIWLSGERHLVFENFNLVNGNWMEGSGSNSTVQDCSFSNFTSGHEIALNLTGSHWLIKDNTIDRTGDSGMLLRGDHFNVVGNTITNTGLDGSIGYGTHGIYLKASRSRVIGNKIIHFRNNGVSVRYPNSTIEHNTIAGGQFGIAWFQYSSSRGTSRWVGNSISFTSIAGIYVSPSDIGGATDENFVIRGNKIYRPGGRARAAGRGGWKAIGLSHNRGRYRVRGNHVV